MAQLQQQFIDSFKVKIAKLETALEQQNVQALTTQVHQLAGSSGSYGFTEISALCTEIEMMTSKREQFNPLISNKTQELICLLKQTTTG